MAIASDEAMVMVTECLMLEAIHVNYANRCYHRPQRFCYLSVPHAI